MPVFYSPAQLLRKPYFMANLITSLAVVAVVTVCTVLVLTKYRLYINPTAEVKFVNYNPNSPRRAASINAVNEEIGTQSILYGYFGSLTEICSDRTFINEKLSNL
jgi:hypothetical protein